MFQIILNNRLHHSPYKKSQSVHQGAESQQIELLNTSHFTNLQLIPNSTSTMVYFKVTDGRTTRRFQMKAGQHSYDHLKERLAALFPEAMKTADNKDNLHLHYTDSDGDQITISTDTEFQEVLAELPAEAVWKLHIRPQRKERTTLPPNRSTAGPHRCSSHPFPTPVRRLGAPRCSPWFPLSHPLSPAHSSLWGFPSWSILDTGFEDLIHQHTHLLLEALGKETRDDAAQKQGASGEAASNEDQSEKENEEGKSKVATATDSTVPGLQVKNFGSWEPRECEGQFGRGTVTGPVGYYVSWTSGTSKEQENSKSKKEEGSTEEKIAGGEDESGHTQENNMETEGENDSS